MVENAIFTLKTQIMATLTLVIVPAKKYGAQYKMWHE